MATKKGKEVEGNKVFISEADQYIFAQGTHYEIYKKLGAHPSVENGKKGMSFAVWAPNAASVNVIGTFNNWNEESHRMKKLGPGGIYQLFIPGVGENELYKYLIPKITIQPLVENALYHGIKNKRGVGKIIISGRQEEDHFSILIEDNGIGISEERLSQVRAGVKNKVSTGKDIYGLYNVNERIRLNFGEKYGIFIESTYGEGTVVSVILPYMQEQL